MSWPEIADTVTRYIGKALGGPTTHAGAVWNATLAVAEHLLRLVAADVATDVRHYRDNLKKRMEARTDEQRALADQKIAQAQEAANQAARSKRTRVIQKLDEEKERLANAKTEAEIEKLKTETENLRRDSQVEAVERLVAAIERLKAQGGEVLLDPDNLNAILSGRQTAGLDVQDVDQFNARIHQQHSEAPADPPQHRPANSDPESPQLRDPDDASEGFPTG